MRTPTKDRIHSFYHWCDRVHRESKLDDNWSSEGSGGCDGQWWEVRPHKLFWWLKDYVLSDIEEWGVEDYSECLLILDKTRDFWWTNEFVSKEYCPLGGSE